MSDRSELEARYEIRERLGRGTSGTAYRAIHRDLNRPVVVKLLHATDEDARRRFVREAKLLARLRHPGVAELVDFDASPSCTYLATRDYQAETLAHALARGPHEPAVALALLASIADALAHIHAEGLVHRDLKPANILLANGEPVLIDFGIALDPSASRFTAAGELMATPTHAAPEHLRGEPAGPSADLYALGVLAHELFTGTNPFAAGNTAETLSRQLNHRVEDWYGPASVAPPVRALLLSLLEKDPADRPRDAAAVRDAPRRRSPARARPGARRARPDRGRPRSRPY